MFEDKVYVLTIEEKPLSPQGKVKGICQGKLDLSLLVDQDASESSVPLTTQVSKIPLTRTTKKVMDGDLTLTVTSQFIKEGLAMDEDMISIASLLSLQASQAGLEEDQRDCQDVGNLNDFDAEADMKQFNEDLTLEISKIVNEIGQLAAMTFDLDTDLIPSKQEEEEDKVPLPDDSSLDISKKIEVDIEKEGEESKGDHFKAIPSKMNKEHPLSRDDDNKVGKDVDDEQTQGQEDEEEKEEDFSNPLEEPKEETGLFTLPSFSDEKSRLLLSIKRSVCEAETVTFSSSSSSQSYHPDHNHVKSSLSPTTTTTILSRDSGNNELTFSQRFLTFLC